MSAAEELMNFEETAYKNFVKSVHQNMYAYNADIEKHDLLLNIEAGLIGEYGEVVDCLKKIVFHKNNKNYNVDNISIEIGDLMWYVTAKKIHEAKYVGENVLSEDLWLDNISNQIALYFENMTNDNYINSVKESLDDFKNLPESINDKKMSDEFYAKCKLMLVLSVDLQSDNIPDIDQMRQCVILTFLAIFDINSADLLNKNIDKLNNRFKKLQPRPDRDSW